MVFVDKKQLLHAVKLYHATNNREYKVVTSKRDLWVSACKHDCSWWLHASLSRKHGLFEIKQYRGPHHCLYPRMNRDHTNISSSYIASHILGQVAVSIKNKCLHIYTYLFVYSVHTQIIQLIFDCRMQNEPDMPIKNVIEDIKKTMNYSISYKKAWHARAKTIKMVFSDWDESYRQLPKFMHALQTSNLGTIVTWKHRYTEHTTIMLVFHFVF
ncbi:hypothetical protein CsSME_00020566 [Camellia sinensis var. sinensis]